jgi:hypothetical protein
MSQHEYIFIAVSIILGLALTRLLHTMGMIVRSHERVVFHWAPITWALSVLVFILQLWWIGWGLRSIDEWQFLDFMVLVFGSIFLYGAAELALSPPESESLDLLDESRRLGRLSALSMLMYFLVGPYVNIFMYGYGVMPSITVPSVGIGLMVSTILVPEKFPTWAIFFAAYSAFILALTI